MNAPRPEPAPLGATVEALANAREAFFWTDRETVPRSGLADAPWLTALQDQTRGRSVLVRTRDQLGAALALVALDGVARRLVLCPPDFDEAHLDGVAAEAGIERLVASGEGAARLVVQEIPRGGAIADSDPSRNGTTEWVMFTSGTTGAPKMVVHTLAGLTGAIPPGAGEAGTVWGTFYDIRRYGGLQILLRALVGGTSLVLSSPDETSAAFLERLGAHGATHVTGTPSHWRKALMSPAIAALRPKYVRLSGEIADQPVLDALRAAFPEAVVAHAFASTEAGVAFDVRDGRAGFPASLIGAPGPVEMRVQDGSLRIRSDRTALRYLGPGGPLEDEEGFVDTGDMLTLEGDRYLFAGRRGGIINVGGLKIHPEEVEAVINAHPAVRMSRVLGRRNPITGAIVVAEVVLNAPPAPDAAGALKDQILETCRAALPPFKVPASIRFVDSLAVNPAGKLERPLG